MLDRPISLDKLGNPISEGQSERIKLGSLELGVISEPTGQLGTPSVLVPFIVSRYIWGKNDEPEGTITATDDPIIAFTFLIPPSNLWTYKLKAFVATK